MATFYQPGSEFRSRVTHCRPVDEVMRTAAAAGGSLRVGGYFGYFSDPGGHLWKVATSG